MDKVMKDNRVLLIFGSTTGTSSKERNTTPSCLIPSQTSRGALRHIFELNCLDDALRSFLKRFTLETEAQLRLQVDWRTGTNVFVTLVFVKVISAVRRETVMAEMNPFFILPKKTNKQC